MSQVEVIIMGQSYKFACKEGEENALIKAASYLNDKMCGIRDKAHIKGTDRIAILAALCISSELLETDERKATEGSYSKQTIAEMNSQIYRMNKVIDEVLAPEESLFS